MSHALEFERVRKEYGGLRPLRLASLVLEQGQRQAVVGLDASAAEALVNLATGGTLPDEGIVRVFGRDTSTVTSPDEWLTTLDRFGMVSARAVLVGDLTAAQNVAMAFTLSVDPIASAVLDDVRRLAVEAGFPLDALDRPLSTLPPDVIARCHLARALAADPAVLVLEHANALTTPADAPAFGRDIARIADGRRLGVLAITADDLFARAVTPHVYDLDAATGRLTSRSGWRSWFR